MDEHRTRKPGEALEEPTRRTFVVRTLSGLGGAALLAACGDTTGTNATGEGATGSSAGAGGGHGGAPGTGGAGGEPGAGGDGGAGGQGACTLYPQQTEGPYYLDLDLVRSDITEGKPGGKLTLRIEVVGADGCKPVEGAAVDVWHCDAGGVYSGYPGQLGGLDTTGQKFLRGTQVSDAEGRVTFITIYPGWYPGRTTHIHFKVHPSPTTEVTSQLYFPEDMTASVYMAAPYDTHGPKDTTNLQDSIAQGGKPPLLAVSETADGYLAELTVTVAG